MLIMAIADDRSHLNLRASAHKVRDSRREEDEERGGHEAGRECAGRGDGAPAGDAVLARGLDLAIVERHLGLGLDHSDLDMGVSLKAEVVVVDDGHVVLVDQEKALQLPRPRAGLVTRFAAS